MIMNNSGSLRSIIILKNVGSRSLPKKIKAAIPAKEINIFIKILEETVSPKLKKEGIRIKKGIKAAS